jgi:hypothetical protein
MGTGGLGWASLKTSKRFDEGTQEDCFVGPWSASCLAAWFSRQTSCPWLRVWLMKVNPSVSTLGSDGGGGVACSTLRAAAGVGAAVL